MRHHHPLNSTTHPLSLLLLSTSQKAMTNSLNSFFLSRSLSFLLQLFWPINPTTMTSSSHFYDFSIFNLLRWCPFLMKWYIPWAFSQANKNFSSHLANSLLYLHTYIIFELRILSFCLTNRKPIWLNSIEFNKFYWILKTFICRKKI